MSVSRKKNWSDNEITTMIDFVESKIEVVKGKFSPSLTLLHKHRAWEEITNTYVNITF